jgi:hypothetical protein
MPIGPIQILVLGFDEPNFRGQVLAEIDRLRQADTVRLIDLLIVRKDLDGRVQTIQRSDLSPAEARQFGAAIGALVGFGMMGEEGAEILSQVGADVLDADEWYVEESIPAGSAAAIALLEHRWAIGLRDAVVDAGGALLADAWIHPSDLIASGLLASADADELLAHAPAGG